MLLLLPWSTNWRRCLLDSTQLLANMYYSVYFNNKKLGSVLSQSLVNSAAVSDRQVVAHW